MIHIERLPAPAILLNNEHVWNAEHCANLAKYYAQHEKYKLGGPVKIPKRPRAKKQRYASPSVKTTLKKMFGNKCCYCEAKVIVVSYQNVEHFRPQSIYPSLAYKWSNLLLACERCNSDHKRDRFPIAPSENQVVFDAKSPCLLNDSDDAVLIDPSTDNPADHFQYDFYEELDNDFIDVVLVCSTERGKVSRSIYGLDRPDLADDRRLHLRHVQSRIDNYLLARYAESKAFERQYKRAIVAMCSSTGQYSAMTKAYVLWKLGTDFDQT